MNLKESLLVKGIVIGDVKAEVIGYYHYDKKTDKHYICSEKTLFRYEVYESSVIFKNKM